LNLQPEQNENTCNSAINYTEPHTSCWNKIKQLHKHAHITVGFMYIWYVVFFFAFCVCFCNLCNNRNDCLVRAVILSYSRYQILCSGLYGACPAINGHCVLHRRLFVRNRIMFIVSFFPCNLIRNNPGIFGLHINDNCLIMLIECVS